MPATVTRKPRGKTTKKAPAKRAAPKKAVRQGPRSEEWKQASKAGHEQAKAIDAYFEMLGKPRTLVPREGAIRKLEAELQSAKGVKRVVAMQRLNDAQIKLQLSTNGGPGRQEVEAMFVAHAAAFSAKKGITYGTWRDAGVPARVLKAAGIAQTRLG